MLEAKRFLTLSSLTHTSFHTSFHLFPENYSNLNVSKEFTYHLPLTELSIFQVCNQLLDFRKKFMKVVLRDLQGNDSLRNNVIFCYRYI
jgi:hypothetical protein